MARGRSPAAGDRVHLRSGRVTERAETRVPLRRLLPRQGHWTASEALEILRDGAGDRGPTDPVLHEMVVRWICRDVRPVDRSDSRADSVYDAVADGSGTGEDGFIVGEAAARRVGYGALLDGVDARVIARFMGLGCPWRLTQVRRGDHVLDLGAGCGLDVLISGAMVGGSGHTVGVDVRSTLFPPTGILPQNAELRVAPAQVTGLPRAWATLVIANGLPPLLTGESEGRVLSEVRRVLRPGGSFVMTALVAVLPGPRCSDELLVAAVRTGKPTIAELRRMLVRGGLAPTAERVVPAPLEGHPDEKLLQSATLAAQI